MNKLIHFPVKGTYYYAADVAIEQALIQPNVPLTFKSEPNNPYDKHAIQIWLPTQEQPTQGLLLGYVPRQLAPIIEHHLQKHPNLYPRVIHKASMGKTIEIDCALLLETTWQEQISLTITNFWVKVIHRLQKWFHIFNRPKRKTISMPPEAK